MSSFLKLVKYFSSISKEFIFLLISIFSFFIINQLSTSLYAGITNQRGEYIVFNQTITSDTQFTTEYHNITDVETVEYCSFVDYGSESNNNSTNMLLYNGNRIIDDEGTLLTVDSQNRWDIRPNNFGAFNAPFIMEFTAVQTSNRLACYGYNSTNSNIFSIDTGTILNANDNLRFVVTSTSCTFYLNGNQVKQVTYNNTNAVKLRIFYNTSGNYLKYKDFRIRQL